MIPTVTNALDPQAEPVVTPSTGTPPSELTIEDLIVGQGDLAEARHTVSVMYIGADWTTGDNFTTASWRDGSPIDFPLSTVVPGFSQGIQGMRIGGRRVIVIPPHLGYGERGAPPAVRPNQTLVFVADLHDVR